MIITGVGTRHAERKRAVAGSRDAGPGASYHCYHHPATTGLTQGEKPGACDCDNETASKTSRTSPAARQQAETTKREKRCDRYSSLLTRDIPRLSKHPASMAL